MSVTKQVKRKTVGRSMTKRTTTTAKTKPKTRTGTTRTKTASKTSTHTKTTKTQTRTAKPTVKPKQTVRSTTARPTSGKSKTVRRTTVAPKTAQSAKGTKHTVKPSVKKRSTATTTKTSKLKTATKISTAKLSSVRKRSAHARSLSIKTPKQREIESTFDFSDLSTTDTKTVKKVIENNFTQKEIKTMACQGKVALSSKMGDFRGIYAHADKTSKSNPAIYLKRKPDEDTVVHELIHHLRITDNTRKKYAKTAYSVDGKGMLIKPKSNIHSSKVKNAEETATTAETELRLATENHSTTEYWNIYNWEVIPENVRKDDRKKLRKGPTGITAPENTVIKGERAKKMLNRNYPDAEISKRRDDESKETALDTWGNIIKSRSKGEW